MRPGTRWSNKRRPRRFAAIAVVVIAAAAMIGAGPAEGGEAEPPWITVTTDFESPLFGLNRASGGRLLVADAGAGPTEVLHGATSLITRLPGVNDVAQIRGSTDVLAVTSGETFALYRITADGGKTKVADLLAFEEAVDPDGDGVESNPFDLAPTNFGRTLIADAAGNSILVVNERGKVNWVATMPEKLVRTAWLKRAVGCPDPDNPEDEFICSLPEKMPADSVPTTVALGPDGAIYVGELIGFPATPGTARVWRIQRGTRHAECGSDPRCRIVARGFTSIIDISFGADGKAYVLELDERSWLALEAGEGSGGTLNRCRLTSPWTCSTRARSLPIPTAVALRGSSVFLTLFSLVPGQAQVARLP